MRGRDFLVDRGRSEHARNVYVPFDVVEDVAGGRVVVEIPADQVDNMDWSGI